MERTVKGLVDQFRNEEMLSRTDDERDDLLEKFFRLYAQQVGEAWKAQHIKFLEVEAKHKDWKPVLPMFRRLITAVRALPLLKEAR